MFKKAVVGEFFFSGSALLVSSVLFLHQRSHEGIIIVTPRNFTQSDTGFMETASAANVNCDCVNYDLFCHHNLNHSRLRQFLIKLQAPETKPT